jgi:hypothetical protein
MKRIILLALFLLAASACSTNTTPSNTNTSAPANSNSNVAASTTPSPNADATASGIIAQEKQIWDDIKTKNPDAFAAMLADDFLYVSNDGVYDKAGTVAGIKQIEATEITLSDWKTVMVDKDTGIVIYTANMKGTNGGKPMPAGSERCGSVWVNRGGKWVGVFHQDTMVEEPPPSNTASTKPSPSPSASPAAAHAAEPVSDDPIAREKQVWDAIKKKDYDRFASFLAEDQVEVFPWGVNDKAASVNGIKQANLSGSTLGDFKTLKINDNAVIVTYSIKGSGDISPSGERGSTLWVKRDGKWLALYHQGTTVKK